MTEASTALTASQRVADSVVSESACLDDITSVVIVPDCSASEFAAAGTLLAPMALFLSPREGSGLDEYLPGFERASFESFEMYLAEVLASATESDTGVLLDSLWELAAKLGYEGSNILKSLTCYELVLERLRREQPGNSSAIAQALSALAECWEFLGNSRRAMDYFKQAAEACEAGGEPENAMDLCFFENAACALFDLEHYSEARPFAQKCLSGREKLLGRCHLLTIMALRMLLRIEIGIKRHGKVGRSLEKELSARFQELAQVRAEAGDNRLLDTLAKAASVPQREAKRLVDQTFEELLVECVESGRLTEVQGIR
ncbi:MAG: tetratricopeptide repeat protein [Candidatus Obscuribacter sp.]|nr:tetratricopeptide repeat protein [Candidatus Obscuribacter sp.]